MLCCPVCFQAHSIDALHPLVLITCTKDTDTGLDIVDVLIMQGHTWSHMSMLASIMYVRRHVTGYLDGRVVLCTICSYVRIAIEQTSTLILLTVGFK